MAIIAEILAGSTSMGIAEYLSMDTTNKRKDIAWKSGLRVSVAYILGGSISLFAYYISNTPIEGLKLSIILNSLALLIFGYYRGKFLQIPKKESITRSLLVGLFAMTMTYYVSKMFK